MRIVERTVWHLAEYGGFRDMFEYVNANYGEYIANRMCDIAYALEYLKIPKVNICFLFNATDYEVRLIQVVYWGFEAYKGMQIYTYFD